MQSINITAINPLFMFALFGTAIACFLLGMASVFKWQTSDTIPLLIGCLLYLVGVVGVTIAFNVPLNDALASVNPDTAEGANLWSRYLGTWTLWNHIRTISALAAAILFTFLLR